MVAVIAMNRRLIRRLALALIAFLAFTQASVALAACTMDRGQMAQMGTAGDDCCGGTEVDAPALPLPNDCVAHCTSDLQLFGGPLALVAAPVTEPVLILPRLEPPGLRQARLEVPAAGVIPPRILQHSFLI
jgi:hypothetical protein